MKAYIKKTDKIEGTIRISGSKNSSLPILSLVLLTNKKIILKNIPKIKDILNMLNCLESLGVKISYKKDVIILKKKELKNKLICESATKIRGSYYLYPGLIHSNKKTYVKYPGGCSFSDRPIDFHIDIFKKTNVSVSTMKDILIFEKEKLKPATFEFNKQTVGATINAIFQSVLIKGTSVIKNQTIEPEIKEVICCLRKMGAKIRVINNNIYIKGVKKLKGLKYTVNTDRIEMGSYILLASSRKSNVTLTNIKKEVFLPFKKYLDMLNINYIYNKEELIISQSRKIEAVNLTIKEYPSFPTDLQPILSASLLNANSFSFIKDTVYPKRHTHVYEIQKLKGDINVIDDVIYIKPSRLKEGKVFAHDLRCGFALIICGICSEGITIIDNFEVLERGYENIIEKLKSLGVQINEN